MLCRSRRGGENVERGEERKEKGKEKESILRRWKKQRSRLRRPQSEEGEEGFGTIPDTVDTARNKNLPA